MFPSNEEDEKFPLSNDEVRWALALKEAALEDESLKELTDYGYVHHALFTNGNVEKSLFQIEGLQQFKEEYKIADTMEEGMALLNKFHEQQPWFFLDIGYEEEDDNFVLVLDYAQLDPSLLRLPEDWRTFLGGFYYLTQMVSANLQSLSQGMIFIGEIEGMGWKNISTDWLRTYWYHLFRFCPIKMKETSWIHNSVIGNLFESLHKSVMNEREHNIQIRPATEVLDGRLDAIFKVPTPEIAFDRLMGKCKILLTKRYHHYQSYRLPAAAAPEAWTEEDILFREAMEAGVIQDDEDDSASETLEDETEEPTIA